MPRFDIQTISAGGKNRLVYHYDGDLKIRLGKNTAIKDTLDFTWSTGVIPVKTKPRQCRHHR
jgi:hypothetical protein